MSREDAYMLCSLAVDLRVTEFVDNPKGVRAMIPKSIFHKTTAMNSKEETPFASPTAK
jgi:acetamidase/formamidase